MIGLIQRVSHAEVRVAGASVGAIGRGLLAFIAVRREDTEAQADRLLERLLSYRVFPDAEDRMNLSTRDTAAGLLLVPQFTLAADTKKGSRGSFSTCAEPAQGRRLFEYLVAAARASYPHVSAGVFGAHMEVSLINDGPVTFWLEAGPSGA